MPHRLTALLSSLLIAVAVGACGDPSGPQPLVIDDSSSTDAWRTVAAGTYNSCAIGDDRAPYCWGFALVSECSITGCAVNHSPVRVDALPAPFDTVASGGGFHCGITTDRAAWCWGEAPGASLGDGLTERSLTPVRVAIDEPIRSVAAGFSSACALTEHGIAWCWGAKIGAQPDDPPEERVWLMPRPVETRLRFASISVGLSACGVTDTGVGYCWGGGYGALGIGGQDVACETSQSCLITATPLPVAGDLRWKSISVGTISTCGVTTDDRGFCWGEVRHFDDPNPHLGLLGAGTFAGSTSPVAVAGDGRFRQIVVGTRHACGITTDGDAFCWGSNQQAELGVGVLGGRSAVPLGVAGDLEFSSLALADHSCGLTVNQNLYCWGTMYGGALGIGVSSTGVRTVPTRVRPPGAG